MLISRPARSSAVGRSDARDDRIAAKPANLTFEQAAAVPVARSTALIGLRDLARIQPGQRLLVNGASGGVGPFAVQIAKAFGADVTAVCSTRNVELVGTLILSGGGVFSGGSFFGPLGLEDEHARAKVVITV